MVSKDTISRAARDFLWMVADETLSKLGSPPKQPQRSTWVERIDPSRASSRTHERVVLHSDEVQMLYAELINRDLLAQECLKDLLVKSGVPDEETYGAFLIPLVRNWLRLEDPFAFDEQAISNLVAEFADAVLNQTRITSSRSTIVAMQYEGRPVELQQGVLIRPITEEELWELGDDFWLTKRNLFFLMPSEDWYVLDIVVEHKAQVDVSSVIGDLTEAVAIGLVLTTSGELGIEHIDRTCNYGFREWGRIPRPKHLNMGGGQYVLQEEMVERLKDIWHDLRAAIESKEHYLRIPLTRLLDGANRDRRQDAVLDYSIGLESLLTKGVKDELSYRFALRGATIINWHGGGKQDAYESLRKFYELRSRIVHGSHVDDVQLSAARHIGESALRQILWWFLQQGKVTLKQALSKIDSRILG